MKAIFYIIVCFLSISLLNAQNVEILSKNADYISQQKIKNFEYIDYQLSLTDEVKIAEFRLTIDKQGKNWLAPVFYKFWEEANKLGANAFAIDNIAWNDDEYIVETSIYYFDDEKMQTNFSYYEENIVVIFGDLNTNKLDKTKSCKVGKEKVEILPYSYVLFQNETGKKMKVSVGGLLGSSVTIKGEPGRFGECFTLGGMSVMPSGGASFGTGGGGVGIGISISSGTINSMDLNLGLFVRTILDTIAKETESN